MQRSVQMTGRAAKLFRKLQPNAQRAVARVIDALAEGIPADSLQLKGKNAGFWRTKAGFRHRVVWYVESVESGEQVVVTWVGDREDVPY